MRLYGELFKNPEGVSFSRCTFVPAGGGYFEGVKSVGDFSPERVVLYFPRHSVEITGQGLSIRKYCDGDLQLFGKITALQVSEGE